MKFVILRAETRNEKGNIIHLRTALIESEEFEENEKDGMSLSGWFAGHCDKVEKRGEVEVIGDDMELDTSYFSD